MKFHRTPAPQPEPAPRYHDDGPRYVLHLYTPGHSGASYPRLDFGTLTVERVRSQALRQLGVTRVIFDAVPGVINGTVEFLVERVDLRFGPEPVQQWIVLHPAVWGASRR
jgi:hypothetical protein